MPAVGELADVLRALGRYLDEQHATGVSIENHDSYLTISWETFTGGVQEQHLQDLDLESLREQAIALRRGQLRGPGGSLAESLRTLGQELDQARVDVATIVEERGTYRVSGQSGGRYFRETYYSDQLTTLSARRRMRRGSAGS